MAVHAPSAVGAVDIRCADGELPPSLSSLFSLSFTLVAAEEGSRDHETGRVTGRRGRVTFEVQLLTLRLWYSAWKEINRFNVWPYIELRAAAVSA